MTHLTAQELQSLSREAFPAYLLPAARVEALRCRLAQLERKLDRLARNVSTIGPR